MSDSSLPALDDLELDASFWPARAAALIVASQEDLETARDLLHDIKALRLKITLSTGPVVAAALAAHRAAVKQRTDLEAPLILAEMTVKTATSRYEAERERKAQVQAALEEAAARAEREKAEAAARELEAANEPELADALREESQVDTAPPIQAPPPRVDGLSFRKTWRFQVENLMALVQAVAAGKVPLKALKADEVFLGQQARSLQSECKIPGVRVWDEKTTAVR